MSSELHPMNDPAHADHYRRDDNRHDWAVRVVRNHARDPQALATAATILLSDYEALKPATVAHLVGKGGVIEERACVTCDQPYPAYTVESTSKCYACRALATVAGSPDLDGEYWTEVESRFYGALADIKRAAPSRVAPPSSDGDIFVGGCDSVVAPPSGAQKDAQPNYWYAHHADLGHTLTSRGSYTECSCGAMSPPPVASPLPRAMEPEAINEDEAEVLRTAQGLLDSLNGIYRHAAKAEFADLGPQVMRDLVAALKARASSAPPVVSPCETECNMYRARCGATFCTIEATRAHERACRVAPASGPSDEKDQPS